MSNLHELVVKLLKDLFGSETPQSPEVRRLAEAASGEFTRMEEARESLEKEIAELKQGELHSKYFYEFSDDVIYRLDFQGRYTFVNPAGTKLLQYTRDEWIGKNYAEFIHPDYRKTAVTAFMDQFKNRIKSTHIEYPVVAKDGTVIWMEHNVQLLIENNHRIGFQGISRDMSLKKLAEEELLKSKNELELRVRERTAELSAINESLRDEIEKRKFAENGLYDQKLFTEYLVDNFAVAAFVIDKDHRVLLWNRSCEALTGISSESIIGTTRQWEGFYDHERPTLADIVLDGDYGRLDFSYPVHYRSLLGERGWHAEGWYENLGGRDRYMIFDSVPVLDRKGEIVAAVETLQDITDLKNAEQELIRVRGLLKNIIDSMPSVLVGVDPDGKVIHWNLEAERLTEVTEEMARGRYVSDVFPLLEKQMDNVKHAIKTRKPMKVEAFPHISIDKVIYSDIMIYPLVTNGIEGAVIRIDDVTSRVQIESMMVQSEKMMSVGGLAAGMAHEINNPLGGILIGVQNIIRRIQPDNAKNREAADLVGLDFEKMNSYLEKREIIKMLDGIRTMGERASNIISNMLSFSRKSASKKQDIDIAGLVDRTLDLASNDYDLQKNYDFRHILIVKEYSTDMRPVPCIPTEIQQVLLNLFKNAAQAMSMKAYQDDRPGITIRLKQDGTAARIEIEDNGPGMDEKTAKRVFEPFFTTKSPGLGTGLGLSVSYFIIANNHRGTMEVESIRNKGTKFIIKIPMHA